MGQLFGKSKSPKKQQDLITEQDKAVLVRKLLIEFNDFIAFFLAIKTIER